MSSSPALCAHSSLQHLTVGMNRGQSDPSVLGVVRGELETSANTVLCLQLRRSAKCLGCVLNLRSISALSPQPSAALLNARPRTQHSMMQAGAEWQGWP